MKKIFIVGAGQMGLDIGYVFANAGFDVVFRDMSDSILIKAITKFSNGLQKLVEKGKMSETEMAAMLSRISTTTDLKSAADADLIIEAIVENTEIKKQLFSELDMVCKPETVFASNTSSISITEIAAGTKRSDRFIGMHFFNPATLMKLVEVIRGLNTSDKTFDQVYEMVQKIGKEPVEVKEGPGFVVNRILVTMINEAVMVAEEGLASPEDIDKAMQLGCNHPMGPLALADLIGLDTCLSIMDVFQKETGDSKYRASRLLRQMVRGGKLGRKSGMGFYDYSK